MSLNTMSLKTDFTTTWLSSIPFKKCISTGLVFDHVRGVWLSDTDKTLHPSELHIFKKYANISSGKLNKLVEEKLEYFSSNNIHIPVYSVKKRDKYHMKLGQYYKYGSFKDYYFSYPALITDEILLKAILDYNEITNKPVDPDNIDLDYARLALYIVVVKTLQQKNYKKSNKYVTKCSPGFIQVHHELLLELGGYPLYQFYWHALKHAGIIECDNIYYYFEGNSKCYGYKINDIYYNIDKDERDPIIHKRVIIKNRRIKLNIIEYKAGIRQQQENNKKFLSDMINDVEFLYKTIDTDEVIEYYKDKEHEFYGVDKDDTKELKKKLNDPNTLTIEKSIEIIKMVQNDNFYYNSSDDFGGRFHSAFTNLKSDLRRFVKYENERYINVDISNSQMVFLATILENPEVVRHLMRGTRWMPINSTGYTLNQVIDIIKLTKESSTGDLELFIEKTKEGTIYEFIAEKLGKKRKQAKIDLIKVIFSNDIQFHFIKKQIGKFFPSLIKLANVLNEKDGLHYLPKICQKFESEVFIKRIAKAFFKVKKKPAVTIHDSMMVHPKDLALFKNVYNEVFKQIGLQPFKIKEEHYEV